MTSKVIKDERSEVVEKASYSVAYIFICFALLLDVVYRAFKTGESSFDLLAIVILSGIVSTIYQAKHQILNKSWLKTVVIVLAISIFVGVMISTLR
jgi:hypothetical protein